MNLARLLLTASLLLNALPAASAQDEPSTPTTHDHSLLITLKLTKQLDQPGELAYTVQLPDGCKLCSVVVDPTYVTQNPREIDLAVRVPPSTPLQLSVHVKASALRRVLLEGTDLTYTGSGDVIHFTLPAQTTDRINSAEFQTHIVYRGLDVRFEHADPQRAAGYYVSHPFPFLQRQAAANLEFAQREAVFMLGLDTYVADEQIGTILLMGFDTNDPHGHTDSPPHMHMHMRWPQVGGTQIGHYYIDERGLLSYNQVGIRGWVGHPILPFKPGDPFTTFDLHARGVYTHTITKEGWLTLGRPGGSQCSIHPSNPSTGFEHGALVDCPGFGQRNVQVSDDIKSGRLIVATGSRPVETFHYDVDTGLLIP